MEGCEKLNALREREEMMANSELLNDIEHHEHHGAIVPEADADDSDINISEPAHEDAPEHHHEADERA
jgi:hypothetical protein